MEELKSKFVGSAKMRAQYEIYRKKRASLLQTIKNSLQENDLILELLSSSNGQQFEFVSDKRKSLMVQQNAGYRNVFS